MTRTPTHLALFSTLVALTIGLETPAQAKVYDDFNGGTTINKKLWGFDNKGTLSQSGGLLHVRSKPNAVYGNLGSTHGFQGDFEFILDWRNFSSNATVFNVNGPTIWLQVEEGGGVNNILTINRWLTKKGHMFFAGGWLHGKPVKGVEAKATTKAGQLRISRTGSTFTMAFKESAGKWVNLQVAANAFASVATVQIGTYSGDNGTFAVDSDWITYKGKLTPPAVFPYGQSCHGLRCETEEWPIPNNKKFRVNLDSAKPNAALVFALGIDNTKWGAVRLPFHLGVAAPNCFIHTSMDVVIAGLKADGSGEARMVLPIPNNPLLSGVSVYCQWAAADTKANAMGLSLSNGLKFTITK